MRALLRLTALALSTLGGLCALEACSTFEPATTATAIERQPYHEYISIGGRFSVSYLHEGKPHSAQGRFQWRQRGDDVDIDLLSPLGQTLARIRVTPFIAMLERPGQQTQSATNASELTEQLLGWAMPADGLRYWLQGFAPAATGTGTSPHPAAPQTARDDFRAGDWQVRYVSWQPGVNGSHPRRIDLARASLSSGDLAMRLVIDAWEPR